MENQVFENREIAESDDSGSKLGKGLAWLSIGLGLAKLMAPHKMSRLIGMNDDGKAPWILRGHGLHDLVAGATLLAKPTSPVGPFMRVAGDVISLASLALAMPSSTSRPRTISAFAMVVGSTAIDTYAGVRQARRKLGKPVKRAVTIARPASEVYAFWRNLAALPQFMTWVESVTELGGGKSHWVVNTPAGVKIEYDAEITDDVPGRRISWRSLPGATVPNCGTVTFLDAPGNRGTEVIVEIQVAAPLGKTIAGGEAQGDLRRLKQVLETGEVMKSDASIHKGPHPAQPELQGGMQ